MVIWWSKEFFPFSFSLFYVVYYYYFKMCLCIKNKCQGFCQGMIQISVVSVAGRLALSYWTEKENIPTFPFRTFLSFVPSYESFYTEVTASLCLAAALLSMVILTNSVGWRLPYPSHTSSSGQNDWRWGSTSSDCLPRRRTATAILFPSLMLDAADRRPLISYLAVCPWYPPNVGFLWMEREHVLFSFCHT